MIKCKRCKKQYIGETKRTLRERFTEHRQASINFNQPTSINQLQSTLNTSRRKAREAYLIHRGQTLASRVE